MTKDMPKSGNDLLVYQIAEVKNGVTTVLTKLDGFQERLNSLEAWRQVMDSQKKDSQGLAFNWMGENALSKIAILALSIALAVVGLISNGVIK